MRRGPPSARGLGQDPPQVDDVPNAAGCHHEILRRGTVLRLEIGSTVHGMHEIVGRVDVAKRLGECLRVRQVADPDVHSVTPRTCERSLPVADQNADVMPLLQQALHHPSPDIARRTGD